MHGFAMWAMLCRSGIDIVGECGLGVLPDSRIEIGYRVRRDNRDSGRARRGSAAPPATADRLRHRHRLSARANGSAHVGVVPLQPFAKAEPPVCSDLEVDPVRPQCAPGGDPAIGGDHHAVDYGRFAATKASAARINSLWLCLPSRGLRGGFRQFDADLPAPSTGLAARERVFGPRGLARARRRQESKTVAGGQGRALGDRAADPVRKKCQGPHGCPRSPR